jgi:hypothetical protein
MNNTSSERDAMGGHATKPQGVNGANTGSSASSTAGLATQVSAVVREAASEVSEQGTTVADSAKHRKQAKSF